MIFVANYIINFQQWNWRASHFWNSVFNSTIFWKIKYFFWFEKFDKKMYRLDFGWTSVFFRLTWNRNFWQNSTFLTKLEIFDKTRNFGQNSKFLTKLEIFWQNSKFLFKIDKQLLFKIEIFFRNRNFCQKSNFLSKIEFFVKNRIFCQK